MRDFTNAGQFQRQMGMGLLRVVFLGRRRPSKGDIMNVPRSVLGPAVAAAIFVGAQGACAAEPAQPHGEIEQNTAQEEPTLPAVTVTGRVDEATTEGTGSYTTGETTAATHLPLSLQETPQSVT